MKRYLSPLITISAIMMLCFFAMMVFPGFAAADDLPTTLHLDLSQPPQRETEDEDLALKKYNEVMEEIAISAEAKEVVEQIKNAVEGVADLTMDISVTEIRGQRIERMCFTLLASVESKVARVEFLEPSELRGYILVANQEKMESRMYQPINNQIAVRGLEDASKEVLSTLSIADLNTFFDFSQYKVEILEVVEEEGVCDYLLQVDGLEEMLQVRVKSNTWFPHEIAVFEEDALVGTMNIGEVVLNPGLCLEELTDLPKVKEVRM
mgnify:CR=1 FL=1